MSRLLVISTRSSLAMGLSNAEHEVVDTRPDELTSTFDGGSEPGDVFVIGVDDPVEALDLVTEIRSVHNQAPVLLVAGRAPGWSAMANHHLDAVEVVPLPVTRPALLDAVDRLLSAVRSPSANLAAAQPERQSMPSMTSPGGSEPVPSAAAATELLWGSHVRATDGRGLTPATDPSADALDQTVADPHAPAVIALAPPHESDPLAVDDQGHLSATEPSADALDQTAAETHASAALTMEPPHESDTLATDERGTTTVPEAPATETSTAQPPPDDPSTQPQPQVSLALLAEHHVETTLPASPSPYGGVAAARLSSRPRSGGPALDLADLRATVAEERPSRHPRATSIPSGAPTAAASTPAADADDASSLVRQLLAVADAVAVLADVAELVVAEAVNRAGATAGAILLPDDGVWRVSRGMRLRPLERRCQLQHDSWLVATVAHGDRGVIVEDTDIARQRLHGAPLANRQQLMAAPVPGLEGVLLLARDEMPFEEADLTALAALGREATEPLRDALDARQLARRLDDLRDFPE